MRPKPIYFSLNRKKTADILQYSALFGQFKPYFARYCQFNQPLGVCKLYYYEKN